MRENLINEMLAIADANEGAAQTLGGKTGYIYWNLADNTAHILREAAEELKQLQELQQKGTTKGIFVSGNDVLNQIQKINEERAKNGMPPV